MAGPDVEPAGADPDAILDAVYIRAKIDGKWGAHSLADLLLLAQDHQILEWFNRKTWDRTDLWLTSADVCALVSILRQETPRGARSVAEIGDPQ